MMGIERESQHATILSNRPYYVVFLVAPEKATKWTTNTSSVSINNTEDWIDSAKSENLEQLIIDVFNSI